MQKSEFIHIIKQGKVSPTSNYNELDSLVHQYPYSSTLQVLRALAAKQEDRIDLSSALEKAAISIQDRKKLYQYIVKDSLATRVQKLEIQEAEHAEAFPVEATRMYSESEENDKTIKSSVSAEKEKQSEDSTISSKPLEEEIMREAVMHLGEIESQNSLSSINSNEDDKVEADESFKKSAPTSFGSWLLSLDSEKKPKSETLDKGLIDKFIQESPQISPVKAAFFSPSQVGKMSLMEDETFVTETLARIYERQGDYKKAARAYRNLMLKYPEKSSYFAALQKKAEDQIKK